MLTFLDEASSLGRDARMIASLPWLPFLRAGAAELATEAATSVHRRLAA